MKSDQSKTKTQLIAELNTLRESVSKLEQIAVDSCQLEETRTENESKLTMALRNSLTVAFHQDKDLRYTWIFNPNPEFKAEDTIGKTDAELLPSDDATELTEIKRRVLDTRVGNREEVRTTIGGTPFFYDLVVDPVYDSVGSVTGIACTSTDITKRKKAQDLLVAANAELSMFGQTIETMNEAVCITDEKHKFIFVNQAFVGTYGYTKKDIIGKTSEILVPPKTPVSQQKKIRTQTLKGGWKGELYNVKKDGAVFPIELSTTPLKNSEGKIIAQIGISTDITERKQAENALKESEEKYRTLFSSIADPIFIFDQDTHHFLECNQAVHKLYGYSREEILTMTPMDLHPQKERNIVQDNIKNDAARDHQYTHITKEGLEKQVEVYTEVTDFQGQQAWISIVHDITERKQAEEEIKEKSIFLESLILQSPLPTFVMDSKGFVAMVNEAFLKFYAVPNKELILGKNALTEPANIKYGVVKYFEEALKGEIVEIPEMEFLSPYDKNRVNTKARLFPIFDTIGTLTNVVVMQEDITEHKQAENRLIESEERYRSVVESTEDSIYLISRDLTYLYANAKVLARLRCSIDELIGAGYKKFHSDQGVSQFSEIIKQIVESGKSLVYEYQSARDQHYFLRTLSPVINPETKAIIAVTIISKDITERKQAEEELKKSHNQLRRLARKVEKAREDERAQLASELHDQLGQVITLLQIDLSLLKDEIPADEQEQQEKIEDMLKTLSNLDDSLNQIYSELRPFMLDELGLIPAMEWYSREFEKRTGTKCKLMLPPAGIELDRGRSTSLYRTYQEIFTNITRHAKATSVLGKLEEKAGMLILTIKDNGRGITSDEINASDALGIIGMKERVFQYDGELNIKGIKGKGTIIQVKLPLNNKGIES